MWKCANDYIAVISGKKKKKKKESTHVLNKKKTG